MYVMARNGHQIDVRATSRKLRVELDGSMVAESDRALILSETGLPARFYLPTEDVKVDLIGPTNTKTRCSFKGEATHWSVSIDGRTYEDVAWSYPDPIPDVEPIRGLVAFYDERVDISIDGERQQRPETPWSRAAARESAPREPG
jgi:uncharacterized protein (DUF427 family)